MSDGRVCMCQRSWSVLGAPLLFPWQGAPHCVPTLSWPSWHGGGLCPTGDLREDQRTASHPEPPTSCVGGVTSPGWDEKSPGQQVWPHGQVELFLQLPRGSQAQEGPLLQQGPRERWGHECFPTIRCRAPCWQGMWLSQPLPPLGRTGQWASCVRWGSGEGRGRGQSGRGRWNLLTVGTWVPKVQAESF